MIIWLKIRIKGLKVEFFAIPGNMTFFLKWNGFPETDNFALKHNCQNPNLTSTQG